MQRLIIIILLLFLVLTSCFSQSVVNSSGNSVKDNTVNFEYSIGELEINTLSSTGNDITQGLLQPMHILKDCKLLQLIPNAFTPNSDAKNDCFGVSNWPVTSSFELCIYNRWGQLVFKTTKPQDCWNGELNGQPQATGVYVYFIKATLAACGSFANKGTILLIR